MYLESQYPGIESRLPDNDKLRLNIAVAIDGEIAPLGLTGSGSPNSEVQFLTAIRGGVR